MLTQSELPPQAPPGIPPPGTPAGSWYIELGDDGSAGTLELLQLCSLSSFVYRQWAAVHPWQSIISLDFSRIFECCGIVKFCTAL